MPEPARGGERIFRGIPVSAGVSHGKVLVLGQTSGAFPIRTISECDLPHELHRLEQALVQTRHQILEVQRRVEEAMGAQDASIFDAHLLVLEDRTLLDEVSRAMTHDKINVEAAFHKVANKYASTLSAMDDEYLRERASDMRDVTERVLNNLLHRNSESDLQHLSEPCILICSDLAPSTAALLDRKKVIGFATDTGSRTSHTAIMARSLQIPAIVGLHDVSSKLNSGEHALLDGYDGTLIINPTDQTLFEYGQLIRRHINLEERLRDVQDKPAVTLDGVRIGLRANIEQPSDAEMVKASGAEGVGLFRTEYLFINRETPPTEEEQFQAYRTVAEALKPNPVVIRTLDLGGDKLISHSQIPQELNPFLGWRAIRFCLVEHAIFRDQLRAILRASVQGNVKIMYPMISCLRELQQANALVESYKAELRAANTPFDEQTEIGIMIEVPSAALTAGTLAKQVRFFSIGTNDLIQYSLAVDRLNERIAHLYEPTHPAILALIKMTADAASQHKIPVSVCGEMAGDPIMVPLLLGLGVTELSASPSLVPQLKFLIRRLKMAEARELAEFALQCESGFDILNRAKELVRKVAPGLLDGEV
ncbi:MAG: phosphoenolpyruvate--protein phosphotransferase [Verrucomicrobiales bacterium]|nr:phosphoenolpyruvate--protein phosphotransferase [Verrucomicrobiales bacterium]